MEFLLPLNIVCNGYALFSYILRCHLGTALAIDGCRHDAACVACSLAAGEESAHGDVLQGVAVADDAHGSRGAGLHTYHCGLIGEESARGAAEVLEATL